MTKKLKRKLEVIVAHAMHISVCKVVRAEDFFKKYSFAMFMGVSFFMPIVAIALLGGETTIGDLL